MKKTVYLLTSLLLLTGCFPDERNNFMVSDTFGLTAREDIVDASVHHGVFHVGLSKSGIGQTTATLQVNDNAQECQTVLDAFNKTNETSFKMVPKELVTFDKTRFSFTEKEALQDLTISWDSQEVAKFIGDSRDYVIPILIESDDLKITDGRSFRLIRLIRSQVNVLQKTISRTINRKKVEPDADGVQPELQENLFLDVELDYPIKNVGISYSVIVDNSLIPAFNQTQEELTFEAAPEGLVTITTPNAVIPESGKSAIFSLVFDKSLLMEDGALKPFPNYVIPIRLATEKASATMSGKDFDLQGLAYDNTVTYVTVLYEELKKGTTITREWGKYASTSGAWSSYISGFTAGADRNVTLDDEYIYIAETNSTKNLWAISLSDPGTYKKLPVGTVLNEGTFYVSCPRIIKNTDSSINGGKDLLVVSNMHTGGDPKLYVYDKGIGEDPSVINMTTWASRRLGDTFTWWGTWQDGMLLFKDFNSTQGTVTFKTAGKTTGTLFLKGRIAAPAVTGAGAYFPFPDDIRKGVSSNRGGTTAWLTSTTKDLFNLDGADNAPTLTALSGYYADTAFRFFELGDKRYIAYTRQVSSTDGRLFILEGEPTDTWEQILQTRKVVYHAAIQNESEQEGIDETPSPVASTHSGMDLDVYVKGDEAYVAVVKQSVGLSLFKMSYSD